MKLSSFYLTEPQKEKMKKYSLKMGVRPSELLRRIIDKFFEELEKKKD